MTWARAGSGGNSATVGDCTKDLLVLLAQARILVHASMWGLRKYGPLI